MKLSTQLLSATLALLMFGCATSYQSRGFTGGFEEAELGENLYKVGFAANGFTSPERRSGSSSVAVLRLLSSKDSDIFLIPQKWRATIKLLSSKEEDRIPIDAVAVVGETDAVANGQLSAKAKAALEKLKARPSSDLPSGANYLQ
jgi:hypothetical protein